MKTEYSHLQRWTRPKHYIGAEWLEWYPVVGQSRDSDALERSNFAVALATLTEGEPRPAPTTSIPLDWHESDTVIVVRENHWAVGWVEWIGVHESDGARLETANEMLRALEDYPCLDEMHYSETEWDEVSEYWANMSVADRVDAIHRAPSDASVFAARRDEVPSDSNGYLLEYLRTP